jgi:hypothetical protein
MIDQPAAWLAYQRDRWMRPDAQRFMRPDPARWIRPDVARYLLPGTNPADVFAALDRKYNPNQPRVPAGQTGGGRWTDGGAIGSSILVGRNDHRIISDADPPVVAAGQQFAQAGGRRSGTVVRINGRTFELTPGQEAELQAVQARADSALARVRQLDPAWKPTPNSYDTVDGRIEAYRIEARQARDRIDELSRIVVGTGPFAAESLPARGPDRNFTAGEHREINRIGSETGCQTCGTPEPGTPRGNFVIDHQPPTALNSAGLAQRLYPQCLSCSLKQGGYVSYLKGRR